MEPWALNGRADHRWPPYHTLQQLNTETGPQMFIWFFMFMYLAVEANDTDHRWRPHHSLQQFKHRADHRCSVSLAHRQSDVNAVFANKRYCSCWGIRVNSRRDCLMVSLFLMEFFVSGNIRGNCLGVIAPFMLWTLSRFVSKLGCLTKISKLLLKVCNLS